MTSDGSSQFGFKNRIIQFINQKKLKTIYYVTLFFGLILRLIVSLNAYGSKHPDEIYQSLEIAHHMVFGSGHLPPEFQSHNSDIESYAASRSWLFPQIFALVMRLGELLNLNYFTGTLVLIKIILAINSFLLIPVIYKLVMHLTEDELTATLTAIFIAFWFRIVEYTVRSFSNTFFLPYLFYGIYLVLDSFNKPLSISRSFEVGFFLGLSTYIRFDLGIIVFAVFLVTFNLKRIKYYLSYVIFSILFWLWGAWFDFKQYNGAQFLSVPINWFTFNVIEGHSKIFGVINWYYYLVKIIGQDMFFWLIPTVICFLLFLRSDHWKSRKQTKVGKSFKKLFWANVITWIVYSNLFPSNVSFSFTPLIFNLEIVKSHKEMRFAIGALVLFLILMGLVSRLLIEFIAEKFDGKYIAIEKLFPTLHLKKKFLTLLIVMIFFLQNVNGIANFWHWDGFEDVNYALMYVGQQDNVEKVIVLEQWYNVGQYTYSHLDEDVDFRFYPINPNNTYTQSHRFHIRSNIFIEDPGIVFVIPEYQMSFYPELEDILTEYSYSIEYKNDGTEVWRINSQ